MVACGTAAEVELIVEEPSLVAEVTSRSSRATDRREKLDAYTRSAALRCYLVVDQRRKHVLAYTRDAAGEWVRDEVEGDGEVAIPFLELRLTTAQIYEDVPLPPLRVREGDGEEAWDVDDPDGLHSPRATSR
jgi:Uma2 family endonuclease